MKRLVAVFGALVVAFLLTLSPAPARADGESNKVGACLSSGQVWLVVTTETGDVMSNQCVGTPGDGEQALAAGGMETQSSKHPLICTPPGHPEQCPKTFDGHSYWSYWHGAPGQDYVYSQEGPQTRTPGAGTIEAWCYSTKDNECAPPQLLIVTNGAEVPPPPGTTALDLPVTQHAAVSVPSTTPWGVIATVAVIVVVFGALIVWQRSRRKGSDGAIGGR